MDQELEPRQMPGRQQFPARFKRRSALDAVFVFFSGPVVRDIALGEPLFKVFS